jgi:hypothetical protein
MMLLCVVRMPRVVSTPAEFAGAAVAGWAEVDCVFAYRIFGGNR